jgi:hypothetical protein
MLVCGCRHGEQNHLHADALRQIHRGRHRRAVLAEPNYATIVLNIGCLDNIGHKSHRLSIAAFDPTRTSSSSQQHGCEGIIGRAFVLRRRHSLFRRPMNLMISRVRPNCRFGDSRRTWGKCDAADREHCEGEKGASRFGGHFDPP